MHQMFIDNPELVKAVEQARFLGFSDEQIAASLNKFFGVEAAQQAAPPAHEHTFEPDHVPGWQVCTACRLTVRL
jgi:hypothetical protein